MQKMASVKNFNFPPYAGKSVDSSLIKAIVSVSSSNNLGENTFTKNLFQNKNGLGKEKKSISVSEIWHLRKELRQIVREQKKISKSEPVQKLPSPEPELNNKGIIALFITLLPFVLLILGAIAWAFIVAFYGGIIAIILGAAALKEINAHPEKYMGRFFAYAAIAIAILNFLLMLFLVGLIIWALSTLK